MLNTTKRFVNNSTCKTNSINNSNLNHILAKEYITENNANNSKFLNTVVKLNLSLERQEKQIPQNGHNGNTSITNAVIKAPMAATEEKSRNENVEDNSIKENEESVIADEEDDDVMEVSIFESSTVETPQKEMFSHLQPKKQITMENEKVGSQEEMFSHLQPRKTDVDVICQDVQMDIENEKSTSMLDEGSAYYFNDESELFQHAFIELGRRLWPSTSNKQLYTKGCLWSPDGTCLLVPVHLDGMHIVELPTDLYTMQEIPENRLLSNLTSAVHVKEGGTVYDCCWYPYMNSSDPATCCWLATRQHEPIHMWDAFSGELRCSYRGYDDVDEVESAISVVFSNNAQKVIGGYKKTIKIFDTNIPGRGCSSIPVKKAVSCFALTTDNDNSVTAGNWSGYINHYDLRAPKLGALFTLGGHSGGITWLKYSPTVDKSWYLFSGARRDNKILQWDMRNYTEPIQVFNRNVQTNQRIYYDITPFNTWLASGDTEGLLRIWNLFDKNQLYEIPLHDDCCNGVSLHPSFPIISTTSGQYHFVDAIDPDEKSSEKIINYENSLLMLWYGPSTDIKN